MSKIPEDGTQGEQPFVPAIIFGPANELKPFDEEIVQEMVRKARKTPEARIPSIIIWEDGGSRTNVRYQLESKIYVVMNTTMDNGYLKLLLVTPEHIETLKRVWGPDDRFPEE